MASMQRTIKRSMIFKGMNKQQRLIWVAQHGGKNNPKYEGIRKKIKKGGVNNG